MNIYVVVEGKAEKCSGPLRLDSFLTVFSEHDEVVPAVAATEPAVDSGLHLLYYIILDNGLCANENRPPPRRPRHDRCRWAKSAGPRASLAANGLIAPTAGRPPAWAWVGEVAFHFGGRRAPLVLHGSRRHSPDAMKRATLTGSGPPRQVSPLTQQRRFSKAGRGGDEGQFVVEAPVPCVPGPQDQGLVAQDKCRVQLLDQARARNQACPERSRRIWPDGGDIEFGGQEWRGHRRFPQTQVSDLPLLDYITGSLVLPNKEPGWL